MASDPGLGEFLARVYRLIRGQQQAIFEMGVKIQALEMALGTNRDFAELLQAATAHVRSPELVKAHETGLAGIDETIRQLLGKTPGLN